MAVMQNIFQQQVLSWFDQHGRKDLPWQHDISCYRVWISEIMLQQTQVKTVIPYYLKFMQHYPTITALAAAPLDEVLHLWTGLGYYARARNLHKAAQVMVAQYHGEFPQQFDEIVALPGIGRSTAGALCAIALQQHYPILDGNVKRVLARYAAIGAPLSVSAAVDQLWQLATQLTPKARVADYTQAMMDLGAMICTRTKPHCAQCPLQTDCRAYQTQTQHLYPAKKASKTLPIKNTLMLIIKNQQGEVLLEKRPPTGIWGGLWSLPQCANEAELSAWAKKQAVNIHAQKILPAFRHTFSHYHLDIIPVELQIEKNVWQVMDAPEFVWYKNDLKLGLAAPVKKLLEGVI
jgi:A/G-specific adenine glycosylase